jgi:hypothetical protein
MKAIQIAALPHSAKLSLDRPAPYDHANALTNLSPVSETRVDNISLSIALHPFRKWADARFDLPFLLGPLPRVPLFDQRAERSTHSSDAACFRRKSSRFM